MTKGRAQLTHKARVQERVDPSRFNRWSEKLFEPLVCRPRVKEIDVEVSSHE